MAQLALPSQIPVGRRPMTTATPKGGGAPYAYPAGVPARLEQLANAFERWTRTGTVPIDGQISEGDARRIVQIQRWLFERRRDPLALRRLELELEECRAAAETASEDDGVERTGDQVWVWRHQQAILQKLPLVFRELTTGKGLGDDLIGSPATLLKVGVAVALGVLILKARK